MFHSVTGSNIAPILTVFVGVIPAAIFDAVLCDTRVYRERVAPARTTVSRLFWRARQWVHDHRRTFHNPRSETTIHPRGHAVAVLVSSPSPHSHHSSSRHELSYRLDGSLLRRHDVDVVECWWYGVLGFGVDVGGWGLVLGKGVVVLELSCPVLPSHDSGGFLS